MISWKQVQKQLLAMAFLLTGATSVVIGCNKKGGSSEPGPGPGPQPPAAKSDVSFWLTRGDRSALLQKQNLTLAFSTTTNDHPTIDVDSAQGFQTIDGFGYTLTGGSALLINALSEAKKNDLLQELFGTGESAIGVSYLRVSIGASDLSDAPFTYNDLPAGQTDPTLQQFTLQREQKDLIPVLKKIVAIYPGIRILGSPWTAPAWMKTNNSFKGGSLKPEYYGVYAQYFVKYIQAMKAEGITIDAVTIQNEPLHPGNNPSMYMEAADQALFIKNHLGPAFRQANLSTKIIVYDHNADRPDYPLTILNDPDAKQYVDGSAFHLYAGNISALSQVRNAHPDKAIYFTEQWIGGPGNFGGDLKWHVENLIVGATRNWSRNVLEWNLAADHNYQPHTDQGGCTTCLGALTISGNTFERNTAYYIIGHASKFVPPGSRRVQSNVPGGLPNVAFVTPEGKKVLIVLNSGNADKSFNIGYKGRTVSATLDAGAVGTFVW
ncbi:MAG TPA: glycoside hydrolase family 30 beta sandwich domain-containing protein [Chitinophagaceae bacterium]|jgi:glucosylceramidase|nr:glycoside hydrolase family 30 beta sandwich domain-containing protein [Chitinophagaceae bacterium]